MDSLDFRITTSAVKYMREYLLRMTEIDALVFTISPVSQSQTVMGVENSVLTMSDDELTSLAKGHVASLPARIEFRWSIGVMRKSRVPKTDLLFVDEIEWFLPPDAKFIVDGRVLDVKNGELQFEPALPPCTFVDKKNFRFEQE